MAKPSHFESLLKTVSQDVLGHPTDLTKYYAQTLSISRVAANSYIQRLEREGWIARSGPKTRPTFSLGYMRQVFKSYDLLGLEEHTAWEKDFSPYFNLTRNVQNIVHHGFTEMVNNAVDHSIGQSVSILAKQTKDEFTLIVSDDGLGVFEKISRALGLTDKRQAIFELSKGKFTSDPSKHSGEGIFFTSRMFDMFSIRANDLKFSHFDFVPNDTLFEIEPGRLNGTSVFMLIQLKSIRTTKEIFNSYTEAPEDYDFSKTVVRMKLAAYGSDLLISRSQAKRIVARFERFKIVELDFSEVEEIGQAFADELFRVYANEYPNVNLIPKNMTRQVESMYLRAVAPRF